MLPAWSISCVINDLHFCFPSGTVPDTLTSWFWASYERMFWFNFFFSFLTLKMEPILVVYGTTVKRGNSLIYNWNLITHNWLLWWCYFLLVTYAVVTRMKINTQVSKWCGFFSPATSLFGPEKQDCFSNHFIIWKLSEKWCKESSLYIFFQPINSSVNLKYLGILLVDTLGCRKINQSHLYVMYIKS